MRRRTVHHSKEGGYGPGRWAVGTVARFIKVLESAEANAEYKGLDKERLIITHATAYQGTVTQAFTPRAMGRATAHYNRKCNFEVILTQVGEEEAANAATPSETKAAKSASAKGAKKGAAKSSKKSAKKEA